MGIWEILRDGEATYKFDFDVVRFLFPSRIKYFVVHSGQKKLKFNICNVSIIPWAIVTPSPCNMGFISWDGIKTVDSVDPRNMNGDEDRPWMAEWLPRHVVDSNRSMLRISIVLQPWTFTDYISQEVLHKIQANRPYGKKTHGVGTGTICGIIWNLSSKDGLAAPFHIRKFRCIFYHPLHFLRSYTAPSGMSIALQKMG